MMNSLRKLQQLLIREDGFTDSLRSTRIARNLQNVRNTLLEHICEVGRGGDLSLIVATERAIVEGDLSRYANSQAMAGSLKTALNEIAVVERHIGIVDDPDKFSAVNQAYSLPKNRKKGLPFDEARQALVSHFARLNNLDKSRLGNEEKQIIDARESNMFQAGKLYAERQAKTLGIDATQGRKRGRSL
jgi:hypothetical protein